MKIDHSKPRVSFVPRLRPSRVRESDWQRLSVTMQRDFATLIRLAASSARQRGVPDDRSDNDVSGA